MGFNAAPKARSSKKGETGLRLLGLLAALTGQGGSEAGLNKMANSLETKKVTRQESFENAPPPIDVAIGPIEKP